MNSLILKMKSRESMWYPSCGNDLRPIHHVAFNNLYIDPSVLIFNDLNESVDISLIASIDGCEVITWNKLKWSGIEISIFKIKVNFGRKNRIKELFFFPLSNNDMFKLLAKYGVSPHCALLHRLNDANDPMEIAWLDAIQILGSKYCYTDNWYLLSLNMELTFRESLIRRSIRYISKQSYFGFCLSKKINDTIRLAINNCFESSIHLFELLPDGRRLY